MLLQENLLLWKDFAKSGPKTQLFGEIAQNTDLSYYGYYGILRILPNCFYYGILRKITVRNVSHSLCWFAHCSQKINQMQVQIVKGEGWSWSVPQETTTQGSLQALHWLPRKTRWLLTNTNMNKLWNQERGHCKKKLHTYYFYPLYSVINDVSCGYVSILLRSFQHHSVFRPFRSLIWFKIDCVVVQFWCP